MAGFERDPLSVRYDPAARRFVGRVLGAWDGGRNGGWVTTLVAAPSERASAWARALGIDVLRIRYTGRGSGIETMYEAAFRKAVFFDRRIYLWARPYEEDGDGERVRNPDREAALEFRWGKRTGGYRQARARAHSIRSASRYAARANPYDRA
jgi:hypothetical protein